MKKVNIPTQLQRLSSCQQCVHMRHVRFFYPSLVCSIFGYHDAQSNIITYRSCSACRQDNKYGCGKLGTFFISKQRILK